MNRQLERQLEILKDKIQQHNGSKKKGAVVLRNFEEMTDVSSIVALCLTFICLSVFLCF